MNNHKFFLQFGQISFSSFFDWEFSILQKFLNPQTFLKSQRFFNPQKILNPETFLKPQRFFNPQKSAKTIFFKSPEWKLKIWDFLTLYFWIFLINFRIRVSVRSNPCKDFEDGEAICTLIGLLCLSNYLVNFPYQGFNHDPV